MNRNYFTQWLSIGRIVKEIIYKPHIKIKNNGKIIYPNCISVKFMKNSYIECQDLLQFNVANDGGLARYGSSKLLLQNDARSGFVSSSCRAYGGKLIL